MDEDGRSRRSGEKAIAMIVLSLNVEGKGRSSEET